MCLSVMDISGAERRALQTWRLRLGQQKVQFPSCCVENCRSWKAAARHPGWFACAATERWPARGVPVATKEAAGIESRADGKGPGLGQPQAPCTPCPALVSGTAQARRGKGGTTPLAYAARSARSMDGGGTS